MAHVRTNVTLSLTVKFHLVSMEPTDMVGEHPKDTLHVEGNVTYVTKNVFNYSCCLTFFLSPYWHVCW